jgi:cytochrome c peroxidase
VHGELSESAIRGRRIFTRASRTSTSINVGTSRPFDRPTDRFDTPTLIELWRTAPYLHDGSATTVRDVLTTRNGHDQHGKTSALTREELDDLCAYVLSL